MDPDFKRSPYLNANVSAITLDIIRFRLGSHYFPIETGRWSRTRRNHRKCITCDVVGDEMHYVYKYSLINRDDVVLPENFLFDWNDENVVDLFRKLKSINLL